MTQNQVTISGKIAFEPKVYSEGKIATIVLNVYAGKTKEGKGKYMDVTVKAFDSKIVESLVNLGKGSNIIVTGRLAEDSYEKDGKKVKNLYVNANYVGMDA